MKEVFRINNIKLIPGHSDDALFAAVKKEGLIWVLFSILIPFKGTAVYEENKDRLYRYKYRRTDGTHVLMRPSKLPMWLFEMEFRFLYYVNYPRIYWAGLTGYFNRKYKNK